MSGADVRAPGADVDAPGADVRAPGADTTERTNTHYDGDVRVFALFLDRTMKYSSALFEDESETLEAAVARKHDYIATALGLSGGEAVLDVGCGWGSVTLDLAARGCEVTAVTPSATQAAYVRRLASERGLSGSVEVVETSFERSGLPSGAFEAITMLGSIVHMPAQDEVLRDCWRLLRPGGRAYVSESCFKNEAARRRFEERPGTRYVRDQIFGWGIMPPLSRLVQHAEDAGFSLKSLIDLSEHYRLTIECWIANAQRNRADLEALEPGVTDSLVRYFEVANAGWGFTSKHYGFVAAKVR